MHFYIPLYIVLGGLITASILVSGLNAIHTNRIARQPYLWLFTLVMAVAAMIYLPFFHPLKPPDVSYTVTFFDVMRHHGTYLEWVLAMVCTASNIALLTYSLASGAPLARAVVRTGQRTST